MRCKDLKLFKQILKDTIRKNPAIHGFDGFLALLENLLGIPLQFLPRLAMAGFFRGGKLSAEEKSGTKCQKSQ